MRNSATGRGSKSESAAETRRRRFRNSQPAAYLRTMIEIVRERGIDPSEVLKGSKLTLALLETPELRITAQESLGVMLRAVQLTGDRGLGLEFGLRSMPTAHGYVGYAAMSCGTLREAFELVIRYVHLRQRDVALALRIEDGWLVLEARDTHGLGPLRHLVHEAIMIGFFRMGGFLLGEEKPQCELWFDWPQPDYFAPYAARLPVVRFSMPAIQTRFPAHYLNRRVVTADPGAVRHAVEQCEREMATSSPPAENLVERVRAELTPGSDGYPDLETVASCLFMSSRTLKRKLEERGASFHALLDETRYRDALRLLGNPDLDIQQIAAALGYQDPPSFTRAFRRWSRTTPSAARTRLLRG